MLDIGAAVSSTLRAGLRSRTIRKRHKERAWHFAARRVAHERLRSTSQSRLRSRATDIQRDGAFVFGRSDWATDAGLDAVAGNFEQVALAPGGNLQLTIFRSQW